MIKVSEMTNEQLDYWVAKAQGWVIEMELSPWWVRTDGCSMHPVKDVLPHRAYTPSTSWEFAGDLLDAFKMDTRHHKDGVSFYRPISQGWTHNHIVTGEDQLRTLCMAVIISKFGEEIEDE